MHNKNGFSLISFLLYLVLFSLISLFMCHMITFLILPVLHETRLCKTLVKLHIASDLFVRDIKRLKNEKNSLKLVTTQALVWFTNDEDVGWSIEDNKLKRSAGIYKNGWRERNTSIIADEIANGTFTVGMQNNRVIGVEMTLVPSVNKEKCVICYVALRSEDEQKIQNL